ncbi:hypothetical protein K488DRAFT_72476 [Vararia minispora EC-137]|uniref:Uncharacterized protein n=1 Tax=Vararia minispora EC-137 TaxID=1314806 RepID=A0ACB8QE81_9AGAM|nr:hypothetical protein K488DRAFT_72476 [Vararia minispora EC-137]
MGLLDNEPQWTPCSEDSISHPCYTRPLLGGELNLGYISRVNNGFGDVCIGLDFTASIAKDQLKTAAQLALARLRFVSPIIAADTRGTKENEHALSWHYPVLSSSQEAIAWARDCLVVLPRPTNIDEFLRGATKTLLPYTLSDGRDQYFRAYLLLGDKECSLFFHGCHSMIDVRPALRALSSMLGWIAEFDSLDLVVSSLQWGTEWKNLPAGPVTSMGGPSPPWEEGGQELFNKAMEARQRQATPTLLARRDTVSEPGVQLRIVRTLGAELSKRLLAKVKSYGLTVTHLLVAAMALAVLNIRPIPKEELATRYYTVASVPISTDRYLIPPHNVPSRFTTGTADWPISWPLSILLDVDDPKERLLATMRAIKPQYDVFMASPHAAQLSAATLKIFPPSGGPIKVDGEGRDQSFMSNVGVLESFIATSWPRAEAASDSQSKLTISAFNIAQRIIAGWLFTHAWSIHDSLHVQVQASDMWDIAQLDEYIDEVVRQALYILHD